MNRYIFSGRPLKLRRLLLTVESVETKQERKSWFNHRSTAHFVHSNAARIVVRKIDLTLCANQTKTAREKEVRFVNFAIESFFFAPCMRRHNKLFKQTTKRLKQSEHTTCKSWRHLFMNRWRNSTAINYSKSATKISLSKQLKKSKINMTKSKDCRIQSNILIWSRSSCLKNRKS